MKNAILFFVLLSSIFFSCKNTKERRVEQFGYELIAYCDTVKLPHADSMLFPNVYDPLFVDVNGIPYLLIYKIKENGPGAENIDVKVLPQVTNEGVMLYTLQLNGPVRHTSADFLMSITLYYNEARGRFEVINFSGGNGCG